MGAQIEIILRELGGFLWLHQITAAIILVRQAAQRAGIKAAFVVVSGNFDRAAYERNFDRAAYERTFDAMEKEGVDGLVVSDSSEHLTNRQLIVELAAGHSLPTIYPCREFVDVGGLMAYGVDRVDMYRRIADMTGQVLRGAKPSDIPFYLSASMVWRGSYGRPTGPGSSATITRSSCRNYSAATRGGAPATRTSILCRR